MLHLYARSKAPSVEDALVESICADPRRVFLALLTKNRLIAARDPHWFRPLAPGTLGIVDRLLRDFRVDLSALTSADIDPVEVLGTRGGFAAIQ